MNFYKIVMMVRSFAFILVVLLMCQGALAQYMPDKAETRPGKLKSYEFPSLQQKHKWHCVGTRIGEGMFIAGDAFLGAAAYTLAMDQSRDGNQLQLATTFFSMGLGLCFNGAIYFGAGRTYEAKLLARRSERLNLYTDSLGTDNFRRHRRYYSDENFATLGGKVLMSAGGVFLASGGIMYLASDNNNHDNLSIADGFMAAGAVFAMYGVVFYGSGKIGNNIFGRGFGLYGKGNTVGLAYNF